jgi:hypothetical protein
MSTRDCWIALVLWAFLLPCRGAAAAELSHDEAVVTRESRDIPEPPCAPLTKRHWYGWQTLATDGAGIALIIAGAGVQYQGPVAATAGGVGLGSLFLGGPIVHMAHGRWGIGVLDFGMRLTLPIVGGAVAGSLECTGECGGPMLAGLMIGLAPIWIDAGILAREDVPLEPARQDHGLRVPRSLARLGVTELHPTTLPTRRGLVLGMGGSF